MYIHQCHEVIKLLPRHWFVCCVCNMFILLCIVCSFCTGRIYIVHMICSYPPRLELYYNSQLIYLVLLFASHSFCCGSNALSSAEKGSMFLTSPTVMGLALIVAIDFFPSSPSSFVFNKVIFALQPI